MDVLGACPMLKSLILIIIVLIASLLLTLASSYYTTYKTITTSGEGYCGEASSCEVKVITGGFPVQYLYDTIGVSVEGVLSFEDTLKEKLFLVDFTFYFILLTLLAYIFLYVK